MKKWVCIMHIHFFYHIIQRKEGRLAPSLQTPKRIRIFIANFMALYFLCSRKQSLFYERKSTFTRI